MDENRDFRIRIAATPDIEILVRLMREFYAEAGFRLDGQSATRSFLSLLSDNRQGCAWVALRAGTPAGYAVLTLRFTMEHGGPSGYVDDLYVEKEYRRQGVAFGLLREIERESRSRNCSALIVEVGKDNRAGLKAYEKLGMKLVDDGRILYRKTLD